MRSQQGSRYILTVAAAATHWLTPEDYVNTATGPRTVVRSTRLPSFVESIEAVGGRHERFRVAPHTHGEYFICTATSGSHVVTVAGCDWVVAPGDLVFLAPETMHSAASIQGSAWEYVSLHVPASIVRTVCGGAAPWRLRGGAGVVRAPALAAQLVGVYAAIGVTSPANAEASALALIAALRRGVLEQAPRRDAVSDEAIPAVLSALESAGRSHPLLATLGESVGLSVFQLIRRFKASVGVSPIAYRTQMRARVARDLLRTKRSIVSSAFSAGYADESHLCRQFARVYGITPGAYRRAYLPAR